MIHIKRLNDTLSHELVLQFFFLSVLQIVNRVTKFSQEISRVIHWFKYELKTKSKNHLEKGFLNLMKNYVFKTQRHQTCDNWEKKKLSSMKIKLKTKSCNEIICRKFIRNRNEWNKYQNETANQSKLLLIGNI